MKLIPRMVLLSLMLFILFSQPVSGQEEDRTDDVLVISGEQEKYHVGRYLEILRDSSGELTIQEVASKRYEDQWFTSQAETPNFGFQTVPYWVRFRVRNQSEQNHHWVLAQGFSNMHYMDLYIPEADGEDFSIVKNGVFSGTEILNSPFSYLSFNLEISPGSEKIYYLRFQNTASMTLPLTLWEPEAYQQHIFWNQIGLAAYYAILLVISVYNAFFFFNLREKEYLYLFLFSVGVLIKDFVYDGMIAMFIPAISPTFAIYLLLISLGTYDFAYVKFIDSFLNLKKKAPKIHLAANFIAYLFLLFGFSGIFLPYNLTANLLLLPALVITILIIITILYFLIKGQRSAWYLLISQVFFLLGGLFLTSTRLGVIPSNFFTEQLQRLGLVWMALVWSLALANRMNTLKNEAEASQRQVEENERRLAQYLDSMPFGVVVYNADDKLRYINRQSLNMLSPIPNGLSLDQIMQSSLEEASHFLGFKIQKTNQPYPMDQLPFTEAIQQKKPVYIDDLTINLGDQSIPLEVWSNPLMADSGEFMGVVIAFQNIQDRLLKEDLLRRSEEIRQKILEGSIIGTWMNDLISGEVIWDARTREIFGLAPDEPATLELGLNLVHPEDHQTAEKAFEQALSLQSDGSYEEEKRIIRSDGQIRWIATRGSPSWPQPAECAMRPRT